MVLGRYKWRGTDPNHPDNRALRLAMEYHLPLIWFIGFTQGRYAPVYPIYLVGEEPTLHQFIVAADAIHQFAAVDLEFPNAEIERAYAARETKQRLHQAPFRAAVLDAYTCKCAVCRFGHASLLDAAHIITDADGGSPNVRNGLSLCNMHHAAYDVDIIGITPDLIVEVNHEILNEIDWPDAAPWHPGVPSQAVGCPSTQEIAAARPRSTRLEVPALLGTSLIDRSRADRRNPGQILQAPLRLHLDPPKAEKIGPSQDYQRLD